jgi:predicted nucleic acid-binding protein
MLMADTDVVVVDATALAAVTFGEARGDEAAALLQGKRLVAPGLFWYEMSEVARVKCVTRPLEAEAILEQLAAAHSLPIITLSPDWVSVPNLALDAKLTAYDAACLSLALDLEAPLVTFDRRLAESAERLGGTA